MDYTYSKAITEIDPTDNSGNTAIDFPDLETSTHAITLRGEYYPSNNLVLKMNYSYEHYSSDDWALDGFGQEDINKVIWTGQESPDFTNHIISFYVTYYIM